MAKLSAGGCEGIVKAIVRIVHLVHLEHCFQATFIETGIMGHKGNARHVGLFRGKYLSDVLLHLSPYSRKYWRMVGFASAQSVHLLTEVTIVVRFWTDEAVERVGQLAIADNDDTHGAYAATLLVGGLEVDGDEITDHNVKAMWIGFIS